MRSTRRGQTLVLFALTMLLVMMMVLMTIGLSTRIHERIEQQTVADAAAYSQSVLTARALNAAATANRTIISQMASVAAAQSLLSWAGFYHGNLNQARDTLAAMRGSEDRNYSSLCNDVDEAYRAVVDEDERLIEVWEPPTPYTGSEGRDRSSADYIREELYQSALDVAADALKAYDQLIAKVETGQIAETAIDSSRDTSPWRAEPGELYLPNGAMEVTKDELDFAIDREQRNTRQQRHMVRATMATRGMEHFVSSRERDPRYPTSWSGSDYVEKRLNYVMDRYGAGAFNVTITDFGTSYFGDTAPTEARGLDGDRLVQSEWNRWVDAATEPNTQRWLFSVATDIGQFRFAYNGSNPCTVPPAGEDSFGYINTGNTNNDDSNHMWRRGKGFDYKEKDSPQWVTDGPNVRHRFKPGQVPNPSVPDSIWPVFVDYRENALGAGVDDEANADGIPKNIATVMRDYSVRGDGDPWEMKTTFKLGDDQVLDLRGKRTSNGTSLRKSAALASGIAYYHRGSPNGRGGRGFFAEPPNLLNPFWRATIVASDFDEKWSVRGRSFIRTLRDVGEDDSADVLQALRNNTDFEAIP